MMCFCVFAMLIGLISCGGQNVDKQNTPEFESQTESTEVTTDAPPKQDILDMDPVTYSLNSNTKGIKILGERCLTSSTQLNCDWTGSGIEMDITHAGGDITFNASATSNCYFRAYVDGEAWENSNKTVYYTVGNSKTSIVLKNVPAGEHRIKVIKVTGYTIARAQLIDVTFAGVIKETAPAENDLYIEFVGDSICCAWGTIGNKQGAYTDQDGTLAYPLMVSGVLEADYSVTALSGQGLSCGDPGMTKGYLYESAMRTVEKTYDFSRQADVVVINIGTNDYTYRSQNNINETSFKKAYLAFLQTVAEKNGDDCVIICLYNCMNDTFGNAILDAVREFGRSDVYTVKMTRGNSGGANHPDIIEQAGYAEFLAEAIIDVIGG